MSVALHPTRSSNWCFSEDERKEIEPIFTDNAENF